MYSGMYIVNMMGESYTSCVHSDVFAVLKYTVYSTAGYFINSVHIVTLRLNLINVKQKYNSQTYTERQLSVILMCRAQDTIKKVCFAFG